MELLNAQDKKPISELLIFELLKIVTEANTYDENLVLIIAKQKEQLESQFEKIDRKLISEPHETSEIVTSLSNNFIENLVETTTKELKSSTDLAKDHQQIDGTFRPLIIRTIYSSLKKKQK